MTNRFKRVVVTGGSGFIGSALCRILLNETDCELVNLDKLTYAGTSDPGANARPGRYRLAKIDVADGPAVQDLILSFKPDAVFHLAAETHVDRSIDGAAPFIQTNVTGTFVLLEACRALWASLPPQERDAFRMLSVSTDEVYGSLEPGDPAFTEETPYDPSSPYSASKAAADHLASAWHRTYGLPVLISNCSNNFGPYQFPEKLIPLAILNAMERKPIRLYGEGTNVRDWLHVDDHARALIAIVEKGRVGETYNVGARNERTNRVILETLCTILDEMIPAGAPHRDLITLVPDRPGHDFRYAIDPAKVEREIGWRPAAPFEQALRETVAWYLANREWWAPLRAGVYAGERIGQAR